MPSENQTIAEPSPKIEEKASRPATGFWKGFAGGLLGGIVVSAALTGGIIALAPVVKSFALNDELIRLATIEQDVRMLADKVETAETAPRMTDMSGLSARLKEIEGRSSGADPAVATLTRRLEEIQAENARLKADLDGVRKSLPGEGVLLNLAERAEQAEKAVRAVAQRRQSAEAALLAAGQLKDAVDRGDPYQAELRSARRFSSPDSAAAFDALSARAGEGVPTRRSLADSFPAVADSILQAESAGDSLWERVKRQTAKLISVRKVDVSGQDRDSVLARAEQALKSGDLAKASEQLATLHGSEATAAAGWIEQAKARVGADRSLSAIVAAIAAESADAPASR